MFGRAKVVDEPTVPVELAGVPSVSVEPVRRHRTASRQVERQNQIVSARKMGRSQAIATVEEALTASAMVMDLKALDAPAPNAVTRTWQHAAKGYQNTVGELNATCMYVGNALSRCTLAVGKRNPDGSVEQGYDGDEPVEDLDGAIAQEASDLVSQIQAKRGGQSELLRTSGEKLFLAGELYYVPEDTPYGTKFDVLSTQELLRDGATWTKYLGPGYGSEPLPDGVNPIRVWRPDGQWSMLATSSVRSCLEILEELVVLTRLVRSSAISSMALAGVFCVPDELDTPDDDVGPDGQIAEATNPLAVDMINTGAKAIDDPASASAWMPYVIQGPSEYLAELRHIPFEASGESQVIQRTEALQRLAQGLDAPVEVVLGHQSTTFANAQQINRDTFTIHLMPTLQLICDALTVAYLWPAMAKKRGIDPESIAQGAPYPDDILSVAVTYDATDLISVPDRLAEMVDVYGKDLTFSTIKASEMRDALNLDPNEEVSDEEIAKRTDAYRLGRIRETIIGPTTDSAVPIQQAAKAPVPGKSSGEQILETNGTEESRGGGTGQGIKPGTPSVATGDLELAYRIAGAIEVTVSRGVERMGAKMRAKAKQADRETWSTVSNADLPLRLNPAQIEEMLGSDFAEPLRTETTTLARQVTSWAAQAEIGVPADIGRRAGDMALVIAEDHVRLGTPKDCPIEAILELVSVVPVG